MTIRSRLILIYTLMLGVIAILGGAYLLALDQWEEAGAEWSEVYLQDERVGRIRSALFREVGWALDVLGGDSAAAPEVWRLDSITAALIQELVAEERKVDRRDHIEGIIESHTELQWTLRQILSGDLDQTAQLQNNRNRLREISDEAADDVAALTQHYRTRLNLSLNKAARWGRYTKMATVAAMILAALQFVLLIVLLRRWFVRPVREVVSATQAISGGHFETRLDANRGDEWGHLSGAINRMAGALESLRRRLKSTERMATLGEAAAFTAHNIKNPLAIIRMTAQVTREDLPPDSAETADSLDDIVTATDRLDSWLGRFLDFARPVEPDLSRVNISDLLNTTTQLAKQRFEDRGVKLLRTDPHRQVFVDADESLLEQALYSILANACESGAKQVTATLAYSAEAGVPSVVIEIADDGRGIDPAMLDRIFEPFQTDKAKGTGLGLAHAKIIVDLHGGMIEVESVPGRGTTMRVRLPHEETSKTGQQDRSE